MMPRHFDKAGKAEDQSSRLRAPAAPNTTQHPLPLDLEAQSPLAVDPDHLRSPIAESVDFVKRRPKRSLTSSEYRPIIPGRQWRPGQEPGIDPAGGHSVSSPVTDLHTECEITVVEFSQEEIRTQFLNNGTLQAFLDSPSQEGTACRWINVNGLSWDVISMIGKKKHFHRLAVEDLLNRRNRTKADWYSDHTYIVLPLQKLVHLDENDSDREDKQHRKRKKRGWISSLAGMLRGGDKQVITNPPINGAHELNTSVNGYATAKGPPTRDTPLVPIRTLQRYHGGPNEERTEYMERASPLTAKGLAVSVEQVSIFLTADNTVVSFFEQSAEDIEEPILTRLSSSSTILRRCSDASMIVQSIVDAIIDLAIPVTRAYQDAIDELELNVLTEADMKQIKPLYILTSEAAQFRSNIYPIRNLVNALRDHKSEPTTGAPGKLSTSGVTISAYAHTYFGDVEDHVVLITDQMDQLRRAADNMIDLIFNTISAFQNESMKQLTLVTILFLPMSFLTGYFGMNFAYFEAVQFNGDGFFWYVAIPVVFVVCIWLMKDVIHRYFVKTRVRLEISRRRKARGVSVTKKMKGL